MESNKRSYGSLVESDNHNSADAGHSKVLSTNGAAINILTIMTGAGMLSLPYVAASMGWFSLVILLLTLVLFLYSYVLLAECLFVVEESNNIIYSDSLIDYAKLGKITFGAGGDKLLSASLGTEFFLALTSFMINIGINIKVIADSVSISSGIIIAALITFILSIQHLKLVTACAGVGNSLTLLTIFALILSGFTMPLKSISNADATIKLIDITGFPRSIGILFFCFGGHGAL